MSTRSPRFSFSSRSLFSPVYIPETGRGTLLLFRLHRHLRVDCTVTSKKYDSIDQNPHVWVTTAVSSKPSVYHGCCSKGDRFSWVGSGHDPLRLVPVLVRSRLLWRRRKGLVSSGLCRAHGPLGRALRQLVSSSRVPGDACFIVLTEESLEIQLGEPGSSLSIRIVSVVPFPQRLRASLLTDALLVQEVPA